MFEHAVGCFVPKPSTGGEGEGGGSEKRVWRDFEVVFLAEVVGAILRALLTLDTYF